MTPTRKGLLGVERLNVILQQYLNPSDSQKTEKKLMVDCSVKVIK